MKSIATGSGIRARTARGYKKPVMPSRKIRMERTPRPRAVRRITVSPLPGPEPGRNIVPQQNAETSVARTRPTASRIC